MLLNALTISEIFSVGGLTALLGIGITFLMLSVLVITLVFMDKGMKFKFSSKKKNTTVDNALTQNISNNEKNSINNDNKNNSQVIAAIMAAVAVVMGEDNQPQNKAKASFVVKSIKRI